MQKQSVLSFLKENVRLYILHVEQSSDRASRIRGREGEKRGSGERRSPASKVTVIRYVDDTLGGNRLIRTEKVKARVEQVFFSRRKNLEN